MESVVSYLRGTMLLIVCMRNHSKLELPLAMQICKPREENRERERIFYNFKISIIVMVDKYLDYILT